MGVVDIKGRPIELRDFSKPLPLPRLTCIFRQAYKDRYAPVNHTAVLLRNLLGRGLYVSRKDLTMSMNFVTIEIKE